MQGHFSHAVLELLFHFTYCGSWVSHAHDKTSVSYIVRSLITLICVIVNAILDMTYVG